MNKRFAVCRIVAATLTVFALGACTLEPHYERPAAPMPASYPQYESTSAQQQASAADLLSDWRSFVRDPYLRQLIELALTNNRDLRQAALKVAQYEAEYRIVRAELGPSITATGTHSASHQSGVTTKSTSLELGTSAWEIDFFGRIRSLKDQALEQYLSTDAARRSTQISLISTTAGDYLTWLADRALLDVTERTVASYRDTYETTLRAANLGSGSMEDVQSARTSLTSAMANLAAYRRAVEQDRNNLIAVIGCPLPDGFPDDRALPDEPLFAAVPEGLPSTLLTERPDIIEAEHALKSANAYIGAARAAFFPTVSLTATGGVASNGLSSLFKAGSGAWAFEPSISVPIFQFGSLRASLDSATISKNIYVAAYEGTIQTAFKEVSNALAARATYVDQTAADLQYVDAAQQYYDIANARYRGGLDSFLTLLTAQRTLFSAQTQLVTDRAAQQTNMVTLYTALGGGWRKDAQVQETAAK
ncbi:MULTISPECIES: efflux transporter outer membrane subunit [unclassified Caballeronia]|jgi:outer membrane protein, multidrug efflux system|uniref:efflux transporter outer membrane subunit n=1 Tax=unclassified Caballeronia TaxID=2646786 RepID=UPI0020284D97|nr:MULTISPECIES: efflux transporter outer membrane subunit [unclassified Caballeronia]